VKSWDRFPRYVPAAKKPPPEHGIRMKKAGTTWWGQHWIEALEHVLRGDAGRLARGRTYARAGRTHDLAVKGGKVTARVTGSRAEPYEVTVELEQLEPSAWRRAIEGMAAQARFSAELLAGEMPQEIDDVFQAAGSSLFPKQRAELKTTCSCPDWGDPCKHVAATHYVLGEAFDRDPFLLFELRGRSKEQVLEALSAARTPSPQASSKRRKTTAKTSAEPVAAEVPTVKLGKLKAADYDRPREPLPALRFTFDEPQKRGALLKQLGAPIAWEGETSPVDVLAPLVRAAADRARRLAMAEPEPGAPESTPEASVPAPKRARTGAPNAPMRKRDASPLMSGRVAPRGAAPPPTPLASNPEPHLHAQHRAEPGVIVAHDRAKTRDQRVRRARVRRKPR
jgi:uncharacterized Zn finger protein